MMNDKTADSNKRRLAVAAISAVALIILVQFVDSYCTEMFGKTQSLSVRTFLMDPRGMSSEAAVAYMSRGMLPFYLIGALTPFIRSYTDIIGRKKMMIIMWRFWLLEVQYACWQTICGYTCLAMEFSYWDIRWTYI